MSARTALRIGSVSPDLAGLLSAASPTLGPTLGPISITKTDVWSDALLQCKRPVSRGPAHGVLAPGPAGPPTASQITLVEALTEDQSLKQTPSLRRLYRLTKLTPSELRTGPPRVNTTNHSITSGRRWLRFRRWCPYAPTRLPRRASVPRVAAALARRVYVYRLGACIATQLVKTWMFLRSPPRPSRSWATSIPIPRPIGSCWC